MKPRLLWLALAGASALAQTSSVPDRVRKICDDKAAEYGPRFISCGDRVAPGAKPPDLAKWVDTGITPPSVSYQPTAVGAVISRPEEVNQSAYEGHEVYKNPFPEIRNLDRSFKENFTRADGKTLRGLPLGWRYIQYFASHQQSAGDQEVLNYLQKDWVSENWPREADGSAGKCDIWSRMALDPQVRETLSMVGQGLVCDDMPMTLGEIKEIYLSLYDVSNDPRDGYDEQKLDPTSYFQGPSVELTSSTKDTMDRNVALSRLGGFARGGVSPSEMVESYVKNLQQGKQAFFNRDIGFQIWNQPVVAMVETLFRGDQDPYALMPTDGFEGATLEGSAVLAELAGYEKALLIAAAGGKAASANGLNQGRLASNATQRLLALAGTQSDSAWRSAAEQADLIQKAKARLARGEAGKPPAIKLAQGSGLQLVMKDLTFIYGDEHEFASMSPDKTKTRSFVFSELKDSATGKTLKSMWTPPVSRLSQFCGQSSHFDRDSSRYGFMGFSVLNPKTACNVLKGDGDDYPVFDGATPPEKLVFFNPVPKATGIKRQALDRFQALLRDRNRCKVFDKTVEFGNAFRTAVQKNTLSAAEVQDLIGKARQAEFLDKGWLKENFCKLQRFDADFARGVQQVADAIRGSQGEFCQ